jgi:hypothetical protein
LAAGWPDQITAAEYRPISDDKRTSKSLANSIRSIVAKLFSLERSERESPLL